MKEQLEKYRQWQKEHPEWELVCDMESVEHLYVQWSELPKAERMSWVGTYGLDARNAFEEFGVKRCKVEEAVLAPDLQLHDVLDWPEGFCMLVFKTANKSFNIRPGKTTRPASEAGRS